MTVTDFARSFLTFRIDWTLKPSQTSSHKPPFTLNSARIQIESSCKIRDRQSGHERLFALGAACKTEFVGVDKGMWTRPNADFCIILSADSYLILKSWDQNSKGVMRYPASLGEQPERQSGRVSDTYERVAINLRSWPARQLYSREAIVKATLADEPLIGRCAFRLHERYDISIDFPIKTMNANERDWVYQADTGPLLFPDMSADGQPWIDSFHLAYIAFNRADYAEFIVQAPTPLSESVSVNHYSRVVQMSTENSVFSAGQARPCLSSSSLAAASSGLALPTTWRGPAAASSCWRRGGSALARARGPAASSPGTSGTGPASWRARSACVSIANSRRSLALTVIHSKPWAA